MPRKLLVATAAVAAILGALAPPLAAQDWTGTGRLQGRVTDRDTGEPVAGAQVILTAGESEDGPEPLATSKKGRWNFLGLKYGPWKVMVKAEGYVPAQAATQCSPDSGRHTLEIELRERAPEPVAEQEVDPGIELLEKGNERLAAGDYTGAREAYTAALEHVEVEGHPDILMEITRTYYQQENVDEAVETLKRLLEIDPQHVDAIKLISGVLINQGRESEAQAYMANLPEGEKLDADAYLNVGISLYNDGKLDEALEEFDRVVAQYPDKGLGYYYRGLVYIAQQKNPEAAADFKRFVELAPADQEDQRVAEAREFLKYLAPEG